MYRSYEHYISSCIEIAQERLSGFSSIAEIAAHEKEINRYPRLDRLSLPRQIHLLDTMDQHDARLARAKACVGRGEILFEHAAAGEGTRLMLGPKYSLNIAFEFTIDKLTRYVSRATGEVTEQEKIATQLDCLPEELLPLSLGTRHMLQLSFDLTKLSREMGESSGEVLARQHLLIIVSKEMVAQVERDFCDWHFFGFNPDQVFFMVQETFHGLSLKNGQFFYDTQSPKRLHNHGQMVIQQSMDRQIFPLSEGLAPDKVFLTQASVAHWLQSFADKISYNIEDLDYLRVPLISAGWA